MPAEEPSSVSVSFTADAAELQTTLDDIAAKSSETADEVEAQWSAVTPEIDDKIVNEQLDKLAEKADELDTKHPTIKPDANDSEAGTKLDELATKADKLDTKHPTIKPGVSDEDEAHARDKLEQLSLFSDELDTKHPTIKPGVSDIDLEESKTKLDDLAAKAAEITAERPDIRPKVSDIDLEDSKAKLDDLLAKSAEVTADRPDIRPKVSDKDFADSVAKLEVLKGLSDAISEKKVTYTVKLAGSDIAKNAAHSDVQSAAKAIAGDLGDVVLKSMATVAIGSVVAPAADVVASGLIYAIGGALTTAFSGANFALALTGSRNPVRIHFTKEVDAILTKFDQAMAPYTAPALHALLSPLSAYLTDVAPDVQGFGKGLESIAKTMTTSLDSPAVKKVFQGIGVATAKEMAQFGPVLAEGLAGLGQLLVAAEPLILQVGAIMESATKHFASAGAGKDESKFFEGLAKDLQQYGPLIHSIFSQVGTDLSTFATDLKPLEGPALKAVNDGLVVLGDILKGLGPVIKDLAGALAEVEKMPGGGTAVGLTTLGLAFEKTRELMGNIVKLGVKLGGKLPGVSQLDDLVGKMVHKIPGVDELQKLWGEVTGSNGGPAAAARTMQTAADKMLAASENQLKAAGVDQEAADQMDAGAGAGDAAGIGGLSKVVSRFAPAVGTLAIAAGVLYAGSKEWKAVVDGLSKESPHQRGAGGSQGGKQTGITGQAQGYAPADMSYMIQAYQDILAGKNIPQSLLNAIEKAQGSGADVGNLAGLRKENKTQQRIDILNDLMGDYGTKGLSGADKAAIQNLAEQVTRGLEEGLKKGHPSQAMVTQIDNLINEAKKKLGIRSPSSVFMEIGQNTVLGEIAGLHDNTPKLLAEVVTMADAVITKAKSFDPQMYAIGAEWGQQITNGLTASASQVAGAIGASASGNGHGGGSGGLVINGPLVHVQSPNGTLPPQIIAQVGQVVQSGLNSAYAAMGAGLRGL